MTGCEVELCLSPEHAISKVMRRHTQGPALAPTRTLLQGFRCLCRVILAPPGPLLLIASARGPLQQTYPTNSHNSNVKRDAEHL